jgi:hypothetical protein
VKSRKVLERVREMNMNPNQSRVLSKHTPLTRVSIAGMHMQMFHASHNSLQCSNCRTFHVTISWLAPWHLHDETFIKRLSAHSHEWPRTSQPASYTCGLSHSFTSKTSASMMNRLFWT